MKKENSRRWSRCSPGPAPPARTATAPAPHHRTWAPPGRARTHQLQRAEEDERAAPRAAAHGGGAPRLLLGFPPRCRAKRGLTASGRSGRVPLPSSSPSPRLCFSTSFVGRVAAPRSAAGGGDSGWLWGRGRGRGWACAERGGPGGACCGDGERRKAGEGYERSGLLPSGRPEDTRLRAGTEPAKGGRGVRLRAACCGSPGKVHGTWAAEAGRERRGGACPIATRPCGGRGSSVPLFGAGVALRPVPCPGAGAEAQSRAEGERLGAPGGTALPPEALPQPWVNGAGRAAGAAQRAPSSVLRGATGAGCLRLLPAFSGR